MAVTLTESAARHVKAQLEREQALGLRLGVRRAGCSGWSYRLDYAREIGPEDAVFESHGVKVVVDRESLTYVDGTELDFVREGLGSHFKFRNPNVKESCGCGESFSV